MNHFYLIGKLVEEAEKGQTQTGVDIVKLKVECKPLKEQDAPEVYELVGFKTIATQEYPKGCLICASGRLQPNNYTKDGVTYYRTNLLISSISIIA